MNRIIPVVIAIIHKDGKFLLTERKGNDPEDAPFGRVWHFPGGSVEFGEELHVALKREIKEELNLNITVSCQLPRIFSALRTRWHGILIPHLCVIQGEENIIIDDESFQYGWFTYGEILKMHSLPFVREMLDDAVCLLKK